MLEQLSNESFDASKDPQKVADRIKVMLSDRTLSQQEIAELNVVAEKLASARENIIKETVNQLVIFLADPLLTGSDVVELRNKLNAESGQKDIILDRQPASAVATAPAQAAPVPVSVQTQAQAPTENLSKLETSKNSIIEKFKNELNINLKFENKHNNKQSDHSSNHIVGGMIVTVGKDSGKFYLSSGDYVLDKNGKETNVKLDEIKTKDSLSIDQIISIVKNKQNEVNPAISSDRIPAKEYSEELKEKFEKFGLDKTKIDLLKSYGLTAKYEGESKSTNEIVDIKSDKGSIEYTKNTEQKYSTSAISLTSDRSNNPNYKLFIEETKNGELYIKMFNESSTFEHYIKKPILQQNITAPAPAPATKPPEGTLEIDQLNMDNFKVGDKLNLQLLNDLADLKKGTFEHSQLERRLKGVSIDDLIKKCEAAINKLKPDEKTKLVEETQNKIKNGEPTNELPYLLSAFLEKYKLPIVSSAPAAAPAVAPTATPAPNLATQQRPTNLETTLNAPIGIDQLDKLGGNQEEKNRLKELFKNISDLKIGDKFFYNSTATHDSVKTLSTTGKFGGFYYDGKSKTINIIVDDKHYNSKNFTKVGKNSSDFLNKPASPEVQIGIEITQSATAEFKRLGIDLRTSNYGKIQLIQNPGNRYITEVKNTNGGDSKKHYGNTLEFSLNTQKIEFTDGSFKITNKTGGNEEAIFIEMNQKTESLLSTLNTLNIPNKDIIINENGNFTIKTQSQGDINISVSDLGFIVTNSNNQQLKTDGTWHEKSNNGKAPLNFVNITALENGIKNLLTASIKNPEPVEQKNKENLTEIKNIQELKNLKEGDIIGISGLTDPNTRILLTKPIEIDIIKNQITINGKYSGVDTILKDKNFSDIKIFKISQTK